MSFYFVVFLGFLELTMKNLGAVSLLIQEMHRSNPGIGLILTQKARLDIGDKGPIHWGDQQSTINSTRVRKAWSYQNLVLHLILVLGNRDCWIKAGVRLDQYHLIPKHHTGKKFKYHEVNCINLSTVLNCFGPSVPAGNNQSMYVLVSSWREAVQMNSEAGGYESSCTLSLFQSGTNIECLNFNQWLPLIVPSIGARSQLQRLPADMLLNTQTTLCCLRSRLHKLCISDKSWPTFLLLHFSFSLSLFPAAGLACTLPTSLRLLE